MTGIKFWGNSENNHKIVRKIRLKRRLGKTELMVSEIGFGGEWFEHKATECTGCKACESRCPFGVKIAERMIKTAGVFGI